MRREDIRRENAKELARSAGGLAEFGRRLQMSDSQVSQIIGKTPTKNIGNIVAPRIEDAFGKPRGWLDVQHKTAAAYEMPNGQDHHVAREERRLISGDRRAPELGVVEIPQYNAGGAMGHGLVLDGLAGVIKSWRVDHEWLRLNVRSHTGTGNLCIVTGFGPSMRPMFNPGDPLLLDKGINTFDHEDAIYFFRVGNYGFIKTVQRIPQPGGGMIYRAKSKNPDYDPFDITPGMDFEVFGKILTIWKSEQF